MATILITGGTGLVGTALTKALTQKGHAVIILTRDPKKYEAKPQVSYAAWDLRAQTIDDDAMRKADYIMHLAGANVGQGRWTDKRKKEIVDSRVQSGKLIAKALREVPNKVKAVISSAATGYYGPDPVVPNPHPFTENDRPASDFLASVVQQWEEAIKPVKESGKRLVILRMGIVLSREGGAYAAFRKTLPLRIASVLGNGKQVVSWIHIDDVVKLFMTAMENETLEGTYNAVAPHPVSNAALIKAIGKAQDRSFITVHVPAIVLKAMLGEMSVEVLKSTTVSAQKIQQAGFAFLFPDIESATRQLEAS